MTRGERVEIVGDQVDVICDALSTMKMQADELNGDNPPQELLDKLASIENMANEAYTIIEEAE